MRLTNFLFALSALALACGPVLPGDTETAGDSSSGTDGSTGAGPTSSSSASDPTTGDATTSTTTTDPTTASPTTGGETTTTGGADCLPSPPFTPLWSTDLVLSPPPGGSAELRRAIARLSDGRLAISAMVRVSDMSSAPGVLWVAPDGQPLGLMAGTLTTGDVLRVLHKVQVAADDSTLVAGHNELDGLRHPYLARFTPGGGEVQRIDLATEHILVPLDFALRGDDVVLTGYNDPAHDMWLAQVDGATGELAWEVELTDIPGPTPRAIAVGVDGEIVAATGLWTDGPPPLFKVWRVDSAGAPLWERDLLPQDGGTGMLMDLAVTPDGHVVALTAVQTPVPAIRLVALALADGAPAWELDVAVESDEGFPMSEHLWVDGDALALAVVHDDLAPGPAIARFHRVSFAGAPLSADPLTLGDDEGSASLVSTRGQCGELVVLQPNNVTPWLGAFAP